MNKRLDRCCLKFERVLPPVICTILFVFFFTVIVPVIVSLIRHHLRRETPIEYSECYEDANGLDYHGTINTTRNGYECMAWAELKFKVLMKFSSLGPSDHNYCRNPNGNLTAWCYTPESDIGWDFCDIGEPSEDCNIPGLPLTLPPKTSTTVAPSDTFEECYVDVQGTDYRGTINSTTNGLDCQIWNEQSPHQHTFTPENYPSSGLEDYNYCRNPDGKTRPWCFTIYPSIRWQHCNVGNPAENCGSSTASPMDSSTVESA
uniref:Apolipoprotein(A)-like n=1 Tax=Saccoglossus kowalevskii TaxID=10224 RepID=A0ABM0MVI9_SACKO|nr:PREDICTED: apolipoprotein(a)-like [Saccoglossus kowalevskii]